MYFGVQPKIWVSIKPKTPKSNKTQNLWGFGKERFWVFNIWKIQNLIKAIRPWKCGKPKTYLFEGLVLDFQFMENPKPSNTENVETFNGSLLLQQLPKLVSWLLVGWAPSFGSSQQREFEFPAFKPLKYRAKRVLLGLNKGNSNSSCWLLPKRGANPTKRLTSWGIGEATWNFVQH